MSEEDILQAIEADSRRRNESVRQMLLEKGRPDLLARFDAKIRDIETGIDGARVTWNALSEAQRRALRFAFDTGGQLHRFTDIYGSRAAKTPPKRIGRATVRNLIARELLACDGGAFDPEKILVLTERGRFVLQFGEK